MLRLSYIIFLFTIMYFSCQTNSIEPNDSDASYPGTVSLAMNIDKAPAEVAKIGGMIYRVDFDTVIFDFKIKDQMATATIENVQSGEWRLEVYAYNKDDIIIYAGSTTVIVYGGQITPVALQLNPTTGSIVIEVTWGNGGGELTSREEILQDYLENYLGSAVGSDELNWTGDLNNCLPGTISDIALAKTLQRIKYFKRFVGMPDNVFFDPVKNAQCQEAALMMDANDRLSHNPTPDWNCYTVNGAAVLSLSLLGSGLHTSHFITTLIRDASNFPGTANRRLLLFSGSLDFGYGCTPNYSALSVYGEIPDLPEELLPEYIPYPPIGYCPSELVFEKWSFSSPSGDLSGADVMMVDAEGNSVQVEIDDYVPLYGFTTVAWTPQNIITNSNEDVEYTVTVSNIIGHNPSSYSYKVIIIQPN